MTQIDSIVLVLPTLSFLALYWLFCEQAADNIAYFCKAKLYRLKEAIVRNTKQKCFENMETKKSKILGLGKMSSTLIM